MEEPLIPRQGNYKKLLSYQKADAIFQITYFFCSHFLKKSDRTVDQMVQAARSGKQNIAEGTSRSSTSSKTEITLLSVAKASLIELLEDYEDFLKVHGFAMWQPGSKEFEYMRNLGRKHNDAEFYMNLIQSRPPETIANICIILLKQTDYLLFRQLERLGKNFLDEGGFSERMFRLRNSRRTNK